MGSRSRPSNLGLVAVAMLVIVAHEAHGDVAKSVTANPVSLEWVAPNECPDKDYVQAQVSHLLGSSAPSPDDKPVSATAEVTQAGVGWRAEIATESEGAKGRRSFQGTSCKSVADVVALVLALMVNPQRVATQQSLAAQSPASAASSAPPPPPPPPPQPREPPVRASVGVLGFADIGTVPSVGFGAGITAGLIADWARAELLVLGETSHSASLTSTPGIGASFRGVRTGVRLCAVLTSGVLEFGPCGGVEIAWMAASGFGIRSPDENATRWEEVVFGGSVRWAFLSNLGLRLEGAAQVPLGQNRGQFTIAPMGVVHMVPAVTGRVGLGLDLRF